MDPQSLIARRVARELQSGNLGIGIPTLVANYAPGVTVAEVMAMTEADLFVPANVPEMKI